MRSSNQSYDRDTDAIEIAFVLAVRFAKEYRKHFDAGRITNQSPATHDVTGHLDELACMALDAVDNADFQMLEGVIAVTKNQQVRLNQ